MATSETAKPSGPAECVPLMEKIRLGDTRRAPGLVMETELPRAHPRPRLHLTHSKASKTALPQAEGHEEDEGDAPAVDSGGPKEWGIVRQAAEAFAAWRLSIPVAPVATANGRLHLTYFTPRGRLGLLEQASDRMMRMYVATTEQWEQGASATSCELPGLTSKLSCVRVASDTSIVVGSCSDSTAVRVWRLEQGVYGDPMVLRGHDRAVTTVAVSPRGTLVASGSSATTVLVWDLSKGPDQRPAILHGHEKAIVCLVFSPNSALVASGSDDRTARVWDLGRPHTAPATLVGHDETVMCAAFSLSGEMLATGSGDMCVRLWAIDCLGEPTCTLAHVLRGHKDWVLSICFSDDGNYIVSGSDDHDIHVWNLGGLSVSGPLVLRGHLGGVQSVSVSPDSKLIASTSFDDTLYIWNLERSCAQQQPLGLHGHELNVNGVIFSPDGKTVASGSADRTVRIWSTDSARLIMVLRGHEEIVTSVCYSPCGTYVVSGSIDNSVRIWDVSCTSMARPAVVLQGHQDWVNSVAYSRDGTMIGSGSDDHTVRIWDAVQGGALAPMVLLGHKEWVQSVCFSSDSKRVASGALDSCVMIWSIEQFTAGRELAPERVLHVHDGAVFSVCFSPNGQYLASGSMDSAVRVWELRTLNEASSVDPAAAPLLMSGHEGQVRVVAFSANSKMIVSGGTDNALRVWSAEKGVELLCFRMVREAPMVSMIADACFSANMDMLACSCGSDVFVFHWAVTKRNLAATCSLFAGSGIGHMSVEDMSAFVQFQAANQPEERLWSVDVFSARIFNPRFNELHLEEDGTRMYRALTKFEAAQVHFPLNPEARLSFLEYALEWKNWSAASIELLLNQMLVFKTNRDWAFHVEDFCWDLLARKHPRLFLMALKALRLFRHTHNLPELESRAHGCWAFCTHSRSLEDLNNQLLLSVIWSHRKIAAMLHGAMRAYKRWMRRHRVLREPHETMLVQTLSLVNACNVSYLRQHKCDILSILAELNMAEGFEAPTVRSLLRIRWLAVEPYFYLQLVLYLILLISFAVYTSFAASESLDASFASEFSYNWVPYFFGISLLLLNLWFVICSGVVARSMGLKRFFREVWGFLDLTCYPLLIMSSVLHMMRHRHQFLLASIASVLLWINLLQFSRGFRGTGMFTRMVFMMAYNIRFFLIILFVLLLGFANASLIVFRGRDYEHATLGIAFVTQIWGVNFGLTPVYDGDSTFDYIFGDNYSLYIMQLILFVVFMFMTTVLLLNTLIALVLEVYNHVARGAAEHFQLEKTKLLLTLECLFLREARTHTKAWVHIAAPQSSSVWSEATEAAPSRPTTGDADALLTDASRALSEAARGLAAEIGEQRRARDVLEKGQVCEVADQKAAAVMAAVQRVEGAVAKLADLVAAFSD